MATVRLVTSIDLRPVLTFADATDAIEAAYREWGDGRLTATHHDHLAVPGLHTFGRVTSALSPSLGWCVFAYSGGNKGLKVPQKLAALFDPDNGQLRCLIESNLLSWLRTGATSAVATRHLARADARTVGIIGAGRQARSQLEAIAAVRPVERAFVHSRTAAARETFAAEMTERLGFPVVAVDTAADATAEADVLSTATTSREPVVDPSAIRPGTHVNAIGQHYADRRELASASIARAAVVVVDDPVAADEEYGELVIPRASGELPADFAAITLADLVAGTAAGRRSDADVTIFLSGGTSVDYLGVAALCWRLAERHDLGQVVDFGP